MNTMTILIADNIEEYRSVVADQLREQGYKTIEAENITQAREILEDGKIDIALIDIRMERENDPSDISGLNLAVRTAPHIPKIIITSYPDYKNVRIAMRQIDGRLPAVIDFIDKAEGAQTIFDAINKIIPLRDIFIVHGHDEVALLKVKDFLTKLHLNPIILKEEPNAGQLIFEKLERSSGNNYAIMLYTPDDECILKNDHDKLEFRVRQNVMLETGYLFGKLGRDRTCILYKENVILPSDILGLGWIKMDSEDGWKIALARELRHAGFYIDMNDIF